VIRTEWRQILTSAFVRMGEQAPFYLFTSFVLTYATKHLSLARDDVLDYILVAAAIGRFPCRSLAIYLIYTDEGGCTAPALC